MAKRELEKRGNKSRVGIWAWDTALKNLKKAGEVVFDRKEKTYKLAPCTSKKRPTKKGRGKDGNVDPEL